MLPFNEKNEPFDPFFYSITDFRQAMPREHHSLSGRTLRPHNAENPHGFDRVQSTSIPLLLCLFFCFGFVNAENLFHIGFMYQQLPHFTTDCQIFRIQCLLLSH